jgi:NitT/TauT family transport system substrate-binding protein
VKIGYKAPVAVAKLVFVGALEAANIPYSLDEGELEHGVVLVNMMSEQSPLPLLASGSIDGFVMNQPAVAVAVHAGQAKVIADLRDLPPDGRWVDHPCCCVATTATVIEERPDVIEALVRLIVLSTQLIHEDPQLAIDVASRWTKNDRQVEAASIPTIHYLAEPTDRWRAGMVNWAELMQDVGAFEDRYAEMSPEQVVDDLLALQFAERVIAELRAEGVLHD